jgi:hypothetical protein
MRLCIGGDFNGNQLIVWNCDCNNLNQKFERISNDRYRWVGHSKCIDVNDGSMALGAKLQIWDCIDGHTHQMFKERPLLGSRDAENVKYTSLAAKLMVPLDVSIDWTPTTNSTESFGTGSIGSVFTFTGFSSTNPVTRVCETAYITNGDPTLECEDMDVEALTSPTWVGAQEGVYFFLGLNGQKATLTVSNDISFTDDSKVAALNLELGDAVAPDDTEALPPATGDNVFESKAFIIGVSAGSGGLLVVIAVLLVYRRRRNSDKASAIELSSRV